MELPPELGAALVELAASEGVAVENLIVRVLENVVAERKAATVAAAGGPRRESVRGRRQRLPGGVDAVVDRGGRLRADAVVERHVGEQVREPGPGVFEKRH